MADTRDSIEFDKELHTLHETKPPVSASKIQTITKLALKHAKHYKNVVYSIERFIQRCNPELKLAGLYVIDSIARAAAKVPQEGGEQFISRFEEKLEGLFPSLLQAPTKDKERMKRTVGLWKKAGLFNVEQLDVIEKAYFPVEEAGTTGTAPGTPQLNPKDPRLKNAASTPDAVAKGTPEVPSIPTAATAGAAALDSNSLMNQLGGLNQLGLSQQALAAAGLTTGVLGSQNAVSLLGLAPNLGGIGALGAANQIQLPAITASNPQLTALLAAFGNNPAGLLAAATGNT
ncbi:SR- and CTD-associated factor 8 [Rhizophlyctis rosea]|nr:SR- and CTD-associated factor 8 [Rhizophlyctis rosea]